MKGNVIVGQSGGPTAAINSSLAGVYRTAKDRGAGKVYGMLHGIQGLLQERYIDLSDYITTELDAELLKRTQTSRNNLEDNGFEIVSSEFERIPHELKDVTPDQRAAIEKLLEKLEEDEDVQNVFHNMKEAEEEE